MDKNIIDEIQILYKKYDKAKKKYEHTVVIENAKKFMDIEKELYYNLDLLNLDEDKWLIDNKNYNVCKKCNYKFITFDKHHVKYKKILHELFHCSICTNF
jgi:hypothetical protein